MGGDRQTDISFKRALRSLVKYRPVPKRDPMHDLRR